MKLLPLLLLLSLCGCASFVTTTTTERNKTTVTQKSTVLFRSEATILRYNLSHHGDYTNLTVLIDRIVDEKLKAFIK